MHKTDDLRIVEVRELDPPQQLHNELPITEDAATTVLRARADIRKILARTDDRLLVVCGPCSIHDPDAALEYAQRLSEINLKVEGDLLLVMRVYFEKPRTIVGWKGLINDPGLDGSYKINQGLRLARKLLLQINQCGVPAGTEFLDLVTGQYITDLVSWGAIGARTTESQSHRELASGLSCPVGFKNATDGTLKVAVDAIQACRHSHIFLSPTKQGHSAIFTTRGNQDSHIILRGGREPNYDAKHVALAATQLENANLDPRIMIDFSHANSAKKFKKQLDVGQNVASQIELGDNRIFGVMFESNLEEGRQDVRPGQSLVYGQSITDACLGWQDTVTLLEQLALAVQKRRQVIENTNG